MYDRTDSTQQVMNEPQEYSPTSPFEYMSQGLVIAIMQQVIYL